MFSLLGDPFLSLLPLLKGRALAPALAFAPASAASLAPALALTPALCFALVLLMLLLLLLPLLLLSLLLCSNGLWSLETLPLIVLKGRKDFERIRPNVGFSLLRGCLVKREGINSENRVRSISSPGHTIPFSSLFCGVVRPRLCRAHGRR